MAPRRKEKYKLPIPLPEGKVLDDMDGNQWALGKMIGSGGFGLIYLAFPTNKPNKDARHVIKVEYQENGPLFSELKFYQRAAKREYIQKWTAQRKLDYLGVPLFYGFGLTDFKGRSYRFMVMERLGIDLQKLSDQNGVFKKSTVLQLGIRVLDILEYIHENEYVHGDIKAANLLLGYTNPDRVYLADYGLSYRYCPNGNHKQYQENPRKGHNGTIEFTSLDAHRGVAPSRRSDVEILGYCMLHWLCGKLPWDKILDDPVAVQTAKTNLLDELPESVLTWAPPGTSCCELAQFLECVHNLAYDEKPDYQKLKKILNPDGVYLGPLEFSTKAHSVHVRPTTCQKVDSPKVTPKAANDLPEKFPKKVCRGTSAPQRTEHEERQPRAVLSRAAAAAVRVGWNCFIDVTLAQTPGAQTPCSRAQCCVILFSVDRKSPVHLVKSKQPTAFVTGLETNTHSDSSGSFCSPKNGTKHTGFLPLSIVHEGPFPCISCTSHDPCTLILTIKHKGSICLSAGCLESFGWRVTCPLQVTHEDSSISPPSADILGWESKAYKFIWREK